MCSSKSLTGPTSASSSGLCLSAPSFSGKTSGSVPCAVVSFELCSGANACECNGVAWRGVALRHVQQARAKCNNREEIVCFFYCCFFLSPFLPPSVVAKAVVRESPKARKRRGKGATAAAQYGEVHSHFDHHRDPANTLHDSTAAAAAAGITVLLPDTVCAFVLRGGWV